jgi:antitoxin (DNA-binding transcriptional repressor) of toxin-antitoxin stability system
MPSVTARRKRPVDGSVPGWVTGPVIALSSPFFFLVTYPTSAKSGWLFPIPNYDASLNLREACWSYIMTTLVPQEGHNMLFNIAEAKARFSELVQKALLGEEVIIAKDHKPLLKLVPLEPSPRERKPGSGKGQLLYMAPDFDETPAGFEDYG